LSTATPDVIEVEIISAVKGVVEKAVAEDWPNSRWTKEILVAVGVVGKRHGYNRCGPGGGWTTNAISVPLVLVQNRTGT
jgi:hypothetical protein